MSRARINHTAGDRPILLLLMSILTFMAYSLEPQQPCRVLRSRSVFLINPNLWRILVVFRWSYFVSIIPVVHRRCS